MVWYKIKKTTFLLVRPICQINPYLISINFMIQFRQAGSIQLIFVVCELITGGYPPDIHRIFSILHRKYHKLTMECTSKTIWT
jgi:hypothetical protein